MNEQQLRQARANLLNQMRLMENRIVLMKAEIIKIEAGLQVYGGCDEIIETKIIENNNENI